MSEELEQMIHRLVLLSQGGPESIQSLMDELRTNLDFARSPQSGSAVMTGAADQLYLRVDTVPWYFCGLLIDFTGATFAGVTYDIAVNVRIVGGGALRLLHTENIAALPAPVLIPAPRDTNTDSTPKGFWNVYGVQVTVTQSAVGGGWSTLPYEIYDGVR